jgi:DNA-binding transcriptional regulator LsrR (DeoR family)
MSDEDEHLRVRVAWLYFMEGLTQADIAARLGITRLRANRLLGEARESGLVNIQVNAQLASCVALERQLVQETGLKDAVVVPTPGDPEQIPAVLGRATAEYLARHLGENRVRGLGIGWYHPARPSGTRVVNLTDLSINSMMGGLTYGWSLLSDRQRVRAPRQRPATTRRADYAGSPRRATRSWAGRLPGNLQRLATNDVALLSAGDLAAAAVDPLWSAARRHGRLCAAGAVGDIMGTLPSTRASRAACGHKRVIAAPIEMLRETPPHGVGRPQQDGDPAAVVGLTVLRPSSSTVDARAALGPLRGAG